MSISSVRVAVAEVGQAAVVNAVVLRWARRGAKADLTRVNLGSGCVVSEMSAASEASRLTRFSGSLAGCNTVCQRERQGA